MIVDAAFGPDKGGGGGGGGGGTARAQQAPDTSVFGSKPFAVFKVVISQW